MITKMNSTTTPIIGNITTNFSLQQGCYKAKECMDWCVQQHAQNDFSFIAFFSISLISFLVARFVSKGYERMGIEESKAEMIVDSAYLFSGSMLGIGLGYFLYLNLF